MRKINRIVVHCSATNPSQNIGAKDIRNWHMQNNGWSDIGYHLVIKRNGAKEWGRDLDGDGDVFEEIGAHAYGFNKDSIGICLVGGINYNGEPDANFTLKQYLTLATEIRNLLIKFPGCEIDGHRDLPGVNKACPCFDVKELLK